MESSCLNVSVNAATKAAELALTECDLTTDPFEAEALAWIADHCAAGVEAGAAHAWTTAMRAQGAHVGACERAWQAAGCRESCYNPPPNKTEKALSEGAFDLASRARLAREFAQRTRAAAVRVREAADGTARLIDLEAALAFEEAFEKARERAKYCLGIESLVGPRSQECSAALALLADARGKAANSEDLGELNAARAAIERRILDAVLQAEDVPAANHKPEGHGPCAV